MQDPPPRLDAPPEALDDDPDLRAVSTHPLVGVEPAAPVRTASVRTTAKLLVVDVAIHLDLPGA